MSNWKIISKNLNILNYLHLHSSINSISEEGYMYLKNKLTKLMYGTNTGVSVKKAVLAVLKMIQGREDNVPVGFISELICAILLLESGFSQHYCIKNLEEHSIKKGFDGIFLKKDDLYLFESKATTVNKETNRTHGLNISKAYNDIIEKISREDGGPWSNAMSHAKAAENNRRKTLINRLEKFFNDTAEGVFSSIEDHNVIIGSTIIGAIENNNDNCLPQIEDSLQNHKSKSGIVLTVHLQSIDIIIKELKRMENNE